MPVGKRRKGNEGREKGERESLMTPMSLFRET